MARQYQHRLCCIHLSVSLGIVFCGLCLQGCAVSNDVPPRAAPKGQPTNPPPPRLEGHAPPAGTGK